MAFEENLETPERENIVQPISGPEESEQENLVSNETIREEIRERFVKILHRVRSNREAKVEADWARYRNIVNLRRTTQSYEGRAKLFLPILKDSVDTLTRTTKDALLSEPYLAVETDVPRWKTEGVQLARYFFEEAGRIRSVLPIFLRQLFTLGTSCLKYSWVKEGRTVKYRERDPEDPRGEAELKERFMVSRYGPKFEVPDMMSVYVWPENKTSYDDLKMVFEDQVVTIRDIRRQVDRGFFSREAFDEMVRRKTTALKENREAKGQVIQEGIELDLDQEDMDLSVVWVKMEILGRGYEEWLKCVVAGDEVFSIIKNPWWFGTPNYKFASVFQEHDYFYGHGIIEAYEAWQYLANDTTNQTADVATFNLNSIVAYDPEEVEDPDVLQVEPMARWPIHPDNVSMLRPPVDLAQHGLILLRFILNIIQEGTKATALVQGAPREGLGKATSTATGVSQLFSAASAAILDQAETVEEQVLTPLARDVEIMAHEMMDEEIVIRLLGPDGSPIVNRVIDPDDLVLSTDVRWISGSRLRQKLAKTQQLMNFASIIFQVPEERMVQQGFVVDLKELVQDVYSSLGLENPERIIKDVTQAVPGIPPELEEELLEAGRQVLASSMDPPEVHMEHIRFHLRSPSENEISMVRKQEHIASHFAAIQALQQKTQEGGGGGTRSPAAGSEEERGGEELLRGLLSQVGGSTGTVGGAEG